MDEPKVQEPSELDSELLTDANIDNLAFITYSKDPKSAGLKKLVFSKVKSFFSLNKLKNIAKLTGINDSWNTPDGSEIVQPEITLQSQINQCVTVESGLDSRLTASEEAVEIHTTEITGNSERITSLETNEATLSENIENLQSRVESFNTNFRPWESMEGSNLMELTADGQILTIAYSTIGVPSGICVMFCHIVNNDGTPSFRCNMTAVNDSIVSEFFTLSSNGRPQTTQEHIEVCGIVMGE